MPDLLQSIVLDFGLRLFLMVQGDNASCFAEVLGEQAEAEGHI